MDNTKQNINPNPGESSGIISTLFYGYTWDIFKKGYKHDLDAEDLYNPLQSDRSALLGDRLESNWKKEIAAAKRNGKNPSLHRALFATFWQIYSFAAILQFFNDIVFRFTQPMLLGRLLDYFKPNSVMAKEHAFFYAGGMVLLNTLNVFLANQMMVTLAHAGMKVKVAVCSLIYRKSLILNKTALEKTTVGKIVNLLSNDVTRFDNATLVINSIWCSPLAGLIVMGLIYKDSGYAGFLGVVAIFIIISIQSYTGKLSAKYRNQTAAKTDERVRLMDEIISGIQVIKMNAWEKPFQRIIRLARRAEIKVITKSSFLRAAFVTFSIYTTRFALFCTLLVMTLMGQEVAAAKVFVFQFYFNLLTIIMMYMFGRGVYAVAEILVTVERIRDYLLSEEIKEAEYSFLIENDLNIKNMLKSDGMIILKDLTVKYSLHSSDNALANINLSLPRGNLVGITGPVGSGKSSLLHTILGELEVISGTMNIGGKISYASQDPWIFGDTIRQNIIFGQGFDKRRYNEVIRVCALEKDLERFKNGDLTIVGDRGASLSGGQKARISLARAVYNDADIYLLDDPLSAVDIHVSKHLHEDCINGYLSGKTRLLVTHQVQYLENADCILVLNNGRIEDEGTFNDLTNNNFFNAKLSTVKSEEMDGERKEAHNHTKWRDGKTSISNTTSEEISIDKIFLDDIDNEGNKEKEKEREYQVQKKELKEGSSAGKVEGNLLFQYLLAGSNTVFVSIVILLFIFSQLSASGVDYFVRFFVDLEEARNIVGKMENTSSFKYHAKFQNVSKLRNLSETSDFVVDWSTDTCLYVYGGGLVSLFAITMITSMSFYKLAMLSSKKLHSMSFGNVVSTTMRFFDTNPSGRILNRFSKDMGVIDEILPILITDSSQMLLSIAGSLLLIVIVNPYFLILICILGIFLRGLQHVYLRSSMNIRRLEGIMRSPVFTHLKTTVEGLTTIRAFRAQDNFKYEFDRLQDNLTGASYMLISSSAAFGFYLDLTCATFIGLVTFTFLIFQDSLGMHGGEVGLAISQAMSMTGFLQYGIKLSAQLANELMSVERVLEYKSLPKEVQLAQPKSPPKQWPDLGRIVFTDMGMRYYENGPLVLKDFNLSIKPKEKVGIVGRTGAGKSSLISALFRLASVDGSILIDDIDTKDISLEDLRSKLSIIPQDPVLYSGTLRYNLDPFDDHADDELYEVIEEVELKDPSNIINRLENRVLDRGTNYSVGQRQLICLARAILKNNRILMLDEATANVDPQTDALIQKTIRRKFVDCTVLTVAHRLNTIMDSDRVLVIDSGMIAEFDHPYQLLQDPHGVFHRMVMETGTANQLQKIAYENYKKIPSKPE